MTLDSKNYSHEDLAYFKKVEEQAINKVGPNYRRYIKGKEGNAYPHHFSWGKEVKLNPLEAAKQILNDIINCKDPQPVPAKKRAPRGSRKGGDLVQLNPDAVMELLAAMQEPNNHAARENAVNLLVKPCSPEKAAKALIQSVKKGNVDERLWLSYKNSMSQATENKTNLK